MCLSLRWPESLSSFKNATFGVLLLIFFLSSIGDSAQFFVSTSGSDTNPGTSDQPFLTITKALSLSSSVFKPGDTLVIRGGVYILTATVTISKGGTSSAPYFMLPAKGERPILDFSSMSIADANRGINLKANYWYIKGLDIKGAGDNGMDITGSYNVIEHCAFYENHDTGLQLNSGASYNQIINCDAYWNVDPSQGNADGFAPKLDVGTGNSFFGCRSWQNSDDGWDGYMRGANDVTTTLENCWCFKNGYLKDGSTSSGNGNGYKMGGSDTKDLRHNFILKKCIAFDNRVKGFDQNNNRGSMTLYNCTGYRNGTNFSIPDTLASSLGKLAAVKNCVALGAYGTLNAAVLQQSNSWNGFSVTNADFLSIDTAGVRGPRKADGSLPDVGFLHLAAGSPLVDAGTDLGLPFSGKAPDLGAFETGGSVSSVPTGEGEILQFQLLSSYPNPFNPTTTLAYRVPHSGRVVIRIYDARGREVNRSIIDHAQGGHYSMVWSGRDEHGISVASGVYLARVSFDETMYTTRLVLLK